MRTEHTHRATHPASQQPAPSCKVKSALVKKNLSSFKPFFLSRSYFPFLGEVLFPEFVRGRIFFLQIGNSPSSVAAEA